MDNRNFDFEKAERLLLSKPWAELTEQERSFLAGEFASENEYEAMREHLLNVSPMIEEDLPELEPDPAILMRLNNAMDLRPGQPEARKVKESSLLGSILALFTFNGAGLKTSLGMAVVVMSFWFTGPRVDIAPNQLTDTIPTHSYDTSQLSFDTLGARPMLFIH